MLTTIYYYYYLHTFGVTIFILGNIQLNVACTTMLKSDYNNYYYIHSHHMINTGAVFFSSPWRS